MLQETYDLLESLLLEKQSKARAENVSQVAHFFKTSACIIVKNSGCIFKSRNSDGTSGEKTSKRTLGAGTCLETMSTMNLPQSTHKKNNSSSSSSSSNSSRSSSSKLRRLSKKKKNFSNTLNPAHFHFQKRGLLNKKRRKQAKSNPTASTNPTNPNSNNFNALYSLITVLNEASIDDSGSIDFGSYSIDVNHIKNVQNFRSQLYMLYAPFQNYRMKYRVSTSMRNNC